MEKVLSIALRNRSWFRRTFLVLDLGLDVVDGIGALDLESDGLPREGLDEDLHGGGNEEGTQQEGEP